MNIKTTSYPENLLSLILDDVPEVIDENHVAGLEHALSSLSEREQIVAKLYFKERRSCIECAKLLELSRGYVHQVIHNIIRKLHHPLRIQYIQNGIKFKSGHIDISESLMRLELSTRLSNALLRNNCETIADVIEAYKSGDIYRFRNIGAVGIDEIAKRITEYTDVKLLEV